MFTHSTVRPYGIVSCLVLVLACMVMSCSSSGGGGGGGGPALVTLSSVTARYPSNGAKWNDYVSSSTGTVTDAACDAASDTACVHGGEKRVVTVTGKTSCTGLTATDALGAFDWTCDASTNPVRMVSTGLKNGKYLSDLLDFTTAGWKANSVTVNQSGSAYASSPSTVWWTNPVVANNDGGSLASAGTVYLVSTSMTGTYTIDASKAAMVSRPGTTITGPGTSATIIWADGSGSARDHLWIEGAIDLAGDQMGIRLTSVRFSVLKGVTVFNSTGVGISLEASSNNRLYDVTSSHHASGGIYLTTASNNNTLTGIVVSHNGQPGITLSSSNNNTLTLVTASSNTTFGVYLNASSGNTLDGITASNNSNRGVSLASSSSNTLSSVTASNNSIGVYLAASSNNNKLSGVTASNNVNYGVFLTSSSNNSLYGIAASNNYAGVLLENSSYNRISAVTTANNSNRGIDLQSSANNGFSDILVSNNLVGIIGSSSTNNRFAGITAFNNLYGIFLYSSASYNALVGVTAANNGSIGVNYENVNSNKLSVVAAVNNVNGLRLLDASANGISTLAAANNSNAGVLLNTTSDNNEFSGKLIVGNNGSDCLVTTSTATPGLDDDANPSDVATDTDHTGLCTPQGLSSFATTTGISLASSFIGKVYSDGTNTSDTGSAVSYPADPAVFDWLKFVNAFRGWGRDGTFGLSDSKGQWATSSGAIWDWSLASADTVIKYATSLPTGSDSSSHRWNGAATQQSDCDTLVPGSTFVTDHCETTFLKNAIEIDGDGIGNDNLLCESNETCLFTQNIGSYQGHGNLVSAGTFTNGTITGVTLLKYETNGR